MSATGPGGSWAATARRLYLVAMAVFLVTLAIGIPNALDVIDPPRDLLLTHVHSGTLGWISLGILASTFWLWRSADRRLALAMAVLVPVYVAAFASGIFAAKAVAGVLLLGAIGWLVVWAWRAYLASERSLPGLAAALGLTTFTYGAILGVVLQVQFALGATWLSGDAIGSHAGAMVFAYLVAVAMGLIEWRLRGTVGLPRGGLVQFGALFVGGLVLSVGLLVGAGQAAGGLYLLVTIVAVVLFAVRVVPAAIRAPWLTAGPERWVAAAALWVLVAIGIFMYLVAQFVSTNDPDAISLNILIASDHATFVGVVTSLLFGLVATIAPDRVGRPRWLDDLVFWGLTLGLAIFVVGLVAEAAEVKRIGAPVMGAAIVLGLVVLALRLWATRDDAGPAEPAVA
jgi:hypothetical protein